MEKAACTDMSVLLVGERGSGKDDCARRIHAHSSRSANPFTYISSDSLISYTHNNSFGKLLDETCGGTLYIDNISMMNEKLQNSLLSLVNSEKRDIRYIVSSCKQIEPLVKKGELSEELYHRFCVMQIRIPALRERKEDIPVLVDEFVKKYSAKYNVNPRLADDLYEKLSARLWPGNVDELENSIHYAIQHSKTGCISTEDLPVWSIASHYTSNSGESLNDELKRIAKELLNSAKTRETYTSMEEYKKLVYPPILEAVLDFTDNNKSQAAMLLGINRNTLKKMLREYEFEN